MAWWARPRVLVPAEEDPRVAEEVARFGQEIRESNQRRLAALAEAERRQQAAVDAASRKRTEERETRDRRIHEAAQAALAQWLETRKVLESRLEVSRQALAHFQGGDGFETVDGALEAAQRASLRAGLESVIVDVEAQLKQHMSVRPTGV